LGAYNDEGNGVPPQLAIDKAFHKNTGIGSWFGNDDIPIGTVQDIGGAPTVIEATLDFQGYAAIGANISCVYIGLDFDPANLGIELT
jgi:hypothetical protein